MLDTSFQSALQYLPLRLRLPLSQLSQQEQTQCEEFRLRIGMPLYCSAAGREKAVPDGTVTVCREDLIQAIELATQASFHTALEKLRSGFLPLSGGHRLGLCGTVVVRDGEITNFRTYSSLNIRIARERKGIAVPLIPRLQQEGRFANTLILASPGCGKTTLLRDLIRCLSDGEGHMRIGLADERGEVASLYNGCPQMDVGQHTDVIDGCPKHLALMLLLRGMTPQVLAVDEITDPGDVHAIQTAAGCGVGILATAHGSSISDLSQRPLYRELLHQKIFQKAVLISLQEGARVYRVEELP